MELPDAVDDHPRGERVGGIDQPAGEGEAVLRAFFRQREKRHRHAFGDLVAVAQVVAADVEVGLAALAFRQFAEDRHGAWLEGGELLLEVC